MKIRTKTINWKGVELLVKSNGRIYLDGTELK
jgi:hypothetical protein